MTFDNALEFKKKLSEKVIISDLEYVVMVVPENKNDFIKYSEKYLNYKCTDETAIDFCSNNNYEVYGINISHGVLINSKKLS
jgi:hypothetical protein